MTHRRTIPIHSYDANGVYLRSEMLPGSQQENGDFIYRLPRNATFENPGEVVKGRVAVFDEKSRTWCHLPDHRKEIWYDFRDRPVQIVRVGNPADWKLRPTPRELRTA